MKFENIIILKKNDLSHLSEEKVPDWIFKDNRFKFILYGGWILSVLLCLSLIIVKISNNIRLNQTSNEYMVELNRYIHENDSLLLSIEENKRLNTFMRMCYLVMITDCPELTHDNLWEFVKSCDPWYPDIIMMQAVHESDCGKSAVAKRCSNLFGMTKPVSRKWRCDKNCKNKKEIYAEYEDWRFSVIDRIFWERWLFRSKNDKPTIDEYMRSIDNVYNTETDGYGNHIYKHAAKYRKMIK